MGPALLVVLDTLTPAERVAFEALIALLDPAVGLAWAPGGRPKVIWDFAIANGTIVEIEMLADPNTMNELELTLFAD